MKPYHLLQIDFLKGFAILAVILEHSIFSIIPPETNNFLWIISNFSIAQAVPVLVVILALNAGMSFARKNYPLLSEYYSRSYLRSRFVRYWFPFLLLFAWMLLIGALQLLLSGSSYLTEGPLAIFGQITAGASAAFVILALLLVGHLPIAAGAGNYFVTLLFQFVFAFPLIYWLYKKWPLWTLLGSFIVSTAFAVVLYPYAQPEMWGTLIGYAYNACILRFLFFITLGLFISRDLNFTSKRNKLILVFAAFYLIFLCLLLFLALGSPLAPTGIFAQGQTVTILFSSLAYAAPFYTAFLVLLGVKYLPAYSTNKICHVIAVFGRTSYHIFLVQIVYFAIWPFTPLVAFLQSGIGNPNASYCILFFAAVVLNVLICTTSGLFFVTLEKRFKAVVHLA